MLVLRSLPGRQSGLVSQPTTTTTTTTTAHLEPLAVRLQHSWAQLRADRWGADIMFRPASKHSKLVTREQWHSSIWYILPTTTINTLLAMADSEVSESCVSLTWHPLLLQPASKTIAREKQVVRWSLLHHQQLAVRPSLGIVDNSHIVTHYSTVLCLSTVWALQQWWPPSNSEQLDGVEVEVSPFIIIIRGQRRVRRQIRALNMTNMGSSNAVTQNLIEPC